MTKFHSITIDFHEKLILQKIYGETECRCLSFEDEADLLAEMVFLLVGRDEGKIKQALELVRTKSDGSLAEDYENILLILFRCKLN